MRYPEAKGERVPLLTPKKFGVVVPTDPHDPKPTFDQIQNILESWQKINSVPKAYLDYQPPNPAPMPPAPKRCPSCGANKWVSNICSYCKGSRI